MYRCGSCKRKIGPHEEKDLPNGKHRCPYCGSRILYKLRPEGLVKVVRDRKIRAGTLTV